MNWPFTEFEYKIKENLTLSKLKNDPDPVATSARPPPQQDSEDGDDYLQELIDGLDKRKKL